MKIKNYVILLILLTALGCRKDTESTTSTTTESPGPVIVGYEPSIERINASVEGFVHDESDIPLENAIVTFGSNSVSTNTDGYFTVSSSMLNKYGELVKVEHPGFLNNVYRFYPTANSNNWLKFKMSTRDTDQISGFSGGSIQIPGGGELFIHPKSLMTPADTLFLGTVDVSVNYIDVNEPGNHSSGTGNHLGINRWLDEVVVSSIGMVSIEVKMPNGTPLSIIEQDSLQPELRLPISPYYDGSLPPVLRSWNFHEPFGIWVEGLAMNRQGSEYVGRLRYFNQVNVGTSYVADFYEAMVLDLNSIPLTNSIVRVEKDSVLLGYDIVDDQGNISGYYPEQLMFELSIQDVCSEQSSATFSGRAGVQNLGAILAPVNATQISATLLCNGSPINEYLVEVSSAFSTSYYYSSSGDTLTIPACLDSNNMAITITETSNQLSTVESINPGATNNLGTIDVCSTGPTDYIRFNYGILSEFVPNPVVDTVNNRTTIYLTPGVFEFYGNSTGTYTGSQSNNFIYDPVGLALYGYMDTIFVTTYTNSLIIGTFKGTVMDTVSQTNVSVDGDFNIEY